MSCVAAYLDCSWLARKLKQLLSDLAALSLAFLGYSQCYQLLSLLLCLGYQQHRAVASLFPAAEAAVPLVAASAATVYYSGEVLPPPLNFQLVEFCYQLLLFLSLFLQLACCPDM